MASAGAAAAAAHRPKTEATVSSFDLQAYCMHEDMSPTRHRWFSMVYARDGEYDPYQSECIDCGALWNALSIAPTSLCPKKKTDQEILDERQKRALENVSKEVMGHLDAFSTRLAELQKNLKDSLEAAITARHATLKEAKLYFEAQDEKRAQKEKERREYRLRRIDDHRRATIKRLSSVDGRLPFVQRLQDEINHVVGKNCWIMHNNKRDTMMLNFANDPHYKLRIPRCACHLYDDCASCPDAYVLTQSQLRNWILPQLVLPPHKYCSFESDAHYPSVMYIHLNMPPNYVIDRIEQVNSMHKTIQDIESTFSQIQMAGSAEELDTILQFMQKTFSHSERKIEKKMSVKAVRKQERRLSWNWRIGESQSVGLLLTESSDDRDEQQWPTKPLRDLVCDLPQVERDRALLILCRSEAAEGNPHAINTLGWMTLYGIGETYAPISDVLAEHEHKTRTDPTYDPWDITPHISPFEPAINIASALPLFALGASMGSITARNNLAVCDVSMHFGAPIINSSRAELRTQGREMLSRLITEYPHNQLLAFNWCMASPLQTPDDDFSSLNIKEKATLLIRQHHLFQWEAPQSQFSSSRQGDGPASRMITKHGRSRASRRFAANQRRESVPFAPALRILSSHLLANVADGAALSNLAGAFVLRHKAAQQGEAADLRAMSRIFDVCDTKGKYCREGTPDAVLNYVYAAIEAGSSTAMRQLECYYEEAGYEKRGEARSWLLTAAHIGDRAATYQYSMDLLPVFSSHDRPQIDEAVIWGLRAVGAMEIGAANMICNYINHTDLLYRLFRQMEQICPGALRECDRMWLCYGSAAMCGLQDDVQRHYLRAVEFWRLAETTCSGMLHSLKSSFWAIEEWRGARDMAMAAGMGYDRLVPQEREWCYPSVQCDTDC